MDNLRIGHGYDVHRLVNGRRLVVGGVEISFEKGLEGHSDADVLLHAVADAILGAMGLPDIGQQFPPTDDAYRDADSLDLLKQVLQLARAKAMRRVISIDGIIMAERPKMNPHIPAMRQNIATALGIDISRVGLKATTCEGLGLVGREEGMAASAVCLIETDG